MNRDIVDKHAKTLANDLSAVLPTVDWDVLEAEVAGELAAALRTASFLIVSASDLATLRNGGTVEVARD